MSICRPRCEGMAVLGATLYRTKFTSEKRSDSARVAYGAVQFDTAKLVKRWRLAACRTHEINRRILK
jgi:hypothetical protein